MDEFNKNLAEFLGKCEHSIKESDFPSKLGEHLKSALEKQSDIFRELIETFKTEFDNNENEPSEEKVKQEDKPKNLLMNLNKELTDNFKKYDNIDQKLDEILVELSIIRKHISK